MSLRHHALHALRWALLGHTHDRAAVEAAAVVLRTAPDEVDPDEAAIRADALELLAREIAIVDNPRPAREQAAAIAAIRAADDAGANGEHAYRQWWTSSGAVVLEVDVWFDVPPAVFP